jgi:hypothetical protein
MRHFATAALLAAPLLAGAAGTAAANNGPCTFGLGCGGTCLLMFPRIHQHGPLYNYGPYYGYPPFEPYGYWNSYLQYTGPVPPPGGYGVGAGAYGWIHGGYGGHPHHAGKGDACPSCGGGHLHHGHGHKDTGCSSCGAAAAAYLNSGNALDRYTGHGAAAASAAFYADGPAAVLTAGFTGR